MTTKLGVYCDKVIEAGWLMAVILVPLFFNVYSSRVFEPDKLTLLRSIALLMAVAWLIKLLEHDGGRHEAASTWRGRILSTPLVLPTLATILVYVISTIGSLIPGVSLFGSYQRLQGMYTTFAYIVVFFMILQGMRRREQIERFFNAVLFTSVSISLYGLIQHDKLDPLPWGGDVTSRVAANMGNAIFVAAYLILAVPLALSRIIEYVGRVVDVERPVRSVGFVLIYLALLFGQIAVWLHFGYFTGLATGIGLIAILLFVAPIFGRPLTDFALLGAYTFIFTAQVDAIIFSQSRGPELGLLAGLYVFALLALLAARRRAADLSRLSPKEIARAVGFALLSPLVALAPAYAIMLTLKKGLRWLWLSWLVQAVLAVLFLAVLNLPQTPLAFVRSMPYVGRLGTVFNESDTGTVRILIWQGAVKLLAPHEPLFIPPNGQDALNVLRPLIGYGPESMYVAYNRFYQPELAHHEARNASPDRAHNETFDALINTGLLGFLVYLILFGSFFYYGLKYLGLVTADAYRRAFIACWAGGAILGAAAAYALDGSFRFFGVGVPLGAFAGLAAYIGLHGLAASRRIDQDPHLQMVVVALTGAVLAHFIEIQFGIAIAATRTHFWAYAGVLVAIVYFLREETNVSLQPAVEAEVFGRRAGRRSGRGSARSTVVEKSAPAPTWIMVASTEAGPATALLASYGAIVGLILMTMVFDFVIRGFNAAAYHYSMVWLFIVTWLLATIISIGAVLEIPEAARDWVRGVMAYLLVSLGTFAIFLLIYWRLLNWQTLEVGEQAVLAIASAVNHLLIGYYIAAGIMMLLMALALYGALSSRPSGSWQYRNWWIYPPLIVAAIWVAMVTNVQVILADMVYKQALPYDDRQEYSLSIPLYNMTIRLAPTQDFYYLFLGRAHLEKAQRTSDPKVRDAELAQSRDALVTAFTLAPLNTDHSANLARLYRAWGGLSTDLSQRQQLLEQSYAYYDQATKLSPNNAQIWNEFGMVAYFLGQFQDAVEKFQHSLSIDPLFPNTYVYLGDSFQALNKPEEALKAHLKAVELYPGALVDSNLVTLPVPGFQERRLEFYQRAGLLESLMAGVARSPGLANDFGGNSLLGNLYLKQNDFDKAMTYLTRAVALNPNDLGTHLAIGYIYSQRGQFDQALVEFQKAVTIAPGDLTAHRNLGSVLRQLNRFDEARQEFERAQQIAPNDVPTIQNLVDLYRLLGRPDDALAQLQKWAQIAPTDWSAFRSLGLFYSETKQITEAISATQKALELAPTDQKPVVEEIRKQLEKQKVAP